jgi:hypothetical protein
VLDDCGVEAMGRKKRNFSYMDPFCYYCDKVFPNEIVLNQH